jgi:hypothetical protein
MNLTTSLPDSSGNRAKGKEEIGHKEPYEVHSKTLGCVQIGGPSGLGTDLQQTHIDARKEGRPEKREAKNGLIPPGDQGDDRRDAQRNCKFIHVNFLKTTAARDILESAA